MDDYHVNSQEEMRPFKKKSSGSTVIIILLILLILGMIGYLLYDRGIILQNKTGEETERVEDSTKDEKQEEKEETLSLTDAKFITIYNALKNEIYEKDRENGYQSFTNAELASISVSGLQESDFVKTQETSQWGDFYYTLQADLLENHLKTYFGNGVTLEKNALVGNTYVLANVNLGGSGMGIDSYDSNTNTFKVRFVGVGGSRGPQPNIVNRKINKATQKGDTITLEEKAIYIAQENYLTFHVYKDPAKTTLLETIAFPDSSITNGVIDGSITVDNYLNQASTITQTYQLDKTTNQWYFVSSKII